MAQAATWTPANAVTLGRIALVPIFAWTLLEAADDDVAWRLVSTGLFVLAALPILWAPHHRQPGVAGQRALSAEPEHGASRGGDPPSVVAGGAETRSDAGPFHHPAWISTN